MSSETQTAFFSYCREDSGFALKLAEDLKAAGAHVWIDQLDIEPGTPWDRAVEDALNKAPRMLVVLSPVSVNSDNVRDEVSFALSRQKRVIPVLYRDCDIPFRLARLQYIDFRPDYERALRILLRALGVSEAETAPSSGARAPVAAAVEGSTMSREEQASAEFHIAELERERAAAAERDRLINEARAEAQQKAAAAEQARAEEQRRVAAERVRVEEAERAKLQQEEREKAADTQARQEQSRREQRLAEQARLQEEARQAAEKARLAQEEQARKEAEVKARQEQLQREEQESVERKGYSLQQLEQQRQKQIEADASAAIEEALRENEPAPAPVGTKQITTAEAKGATASVLTEQHGEAPVARPAGASKIYVWCAVAVVLLIGLTFLLMHQRQKPVGLSAVGGKSGENAVAAAPSNAASTTPPPTGTTNSPGQGNSAKEPASATANGQSATEASKTATPVVKDNPLQAKTPVNVSKMASAASAPAGHTRVTLPPDISKTFLIHEVAPPYPPLARQARVHGIVTLKVIIDKTGAVESIKTVSGHPLLVPTAIDAVKQFRYRPFVVDDKPVEVDTVVTVNFALTN